MTAGMNARWLLALAFLGCAPADPADAPESAESTESDLTTYGRGVLATGGGYALNQPNVARELDEAGAANVPGVLTSHHSTSPYMFAATVELVAWSSVSLSGGFGDPTGAMVVRLEGKATSRQGKAAKALYEALNITAKAENGAMVKRTPRGTVSCYAYTDHYQCALSALDHVAAK